MVGEVRHRSEWDCWVTQWCKSVEILHIVGINSACYVVIEIPCGDYTAPISAPPSQSALAADQVSSIPSSGEGVPSEVKQSIR